MIRVRSANTREGNDHELVVPIARMVRIMPLGNRSRGRNHRHSLIGNGSNAVRLDLRAVLGDVANLAASVAGLASFAVQRAAIWSSAVAGDVSEFAASVAFHCLRLAISSVMVWSSTLVASCSARNTTEAAATTESGTTTKSATGTTSAAADAAWNSADAWTGWASAVALSDISKFHSFSRQRNLQQDDLAVHMYSIFRWWHH